MKTTPVKKSKTRVFSALAVGALLWLYNPSVFAASGNWNVDASGNWSVATDWSSNPTVPGTAPGDVVGLNYPITAARTVTLDVPAMIGTLNIGSPTSPFFGYTLSTSTGQTLTLNNGGAGAQIVQATTGGAADTISTSVSLNDNLAVSNVNSLTLSGVVSNSPSLSAVTIVKNGGGMLTLSGANTFVASNITVNAGTLYHPNAAANTGTNGAFGNISGGGMNIYINSGATLSSDKNNWFGNQTVADSSLPTINITGGTLAITNNYTTIGALNLTNDATVTSTGTGSGKYYGFQLRDNVTVGGTSPSTMSGSRDYHLNTATVFDVQNTGGSPADLIVTANLRDQSGDFGTAAGGLTKNGPGTMLLSGVNVYSGETLINAGTLQIGDGTVNDGYVTGYIDDEANLVFANPTAWTYTNYIVGAGTVVKTGAGTLTLAANCYYTGSTVVSNGVLNFAAAQSISGSLTVNDGTTLEVSALQDATYLSPSSLTVGTTTGGELEFSLGGSITGPNASTLLTPISLALNGTTAIKIAHCPQSLGSYPLFNGYNGTSPLTLVSQPAGVLGQLTASGGVVYYQVTNTVTDVWTAQTSTNWDTVTANWTNNLQATTYSQGDPVLFDDTANGASPLLVNIVSSVLPNAVTVSNVSKAYVIGGRAIEGMTGLTKTGGNTLTLTGTNAFTGNLAILGGTFEIGGSGQLGAGAYPGNIDDEALLQYDSSNPQTLSGVISGSGALLVTNGAVTLSGANTYSSGTTLGNGTLLAQGSSTPTSGTVTSGPLGTGTVTLNGGTFGFFGGGYTVANNVSVGAAANIEVASGQNEVHNGNWSGSGNLTLIANGTTGQWQFGGDNSGYTGTLTQNGGNTSLAFNNTSAGSAGAAWVFNNNVNQRTRLNFGAGTISFGSLSGNGSIANVAASGAATVSVGALNTSTTFSGVLGGSTGGQGQNISLVKVGSGVLMLTGANTYTGGTIISAGVLGISNRTALSTAGNITFDGGTLQYSRVSGANVDCSPRVANSTAPISIDLNGTNVTFASTLPSSNTGGLALTNSSGAGTNKLTLTAPEAYTGTTIINGGTLALSGGGAINSSTNITVASGAIFDVSGVSYTLGASQTLAGNGVVTGVVATASSGSTILPGDAGTVGTLTFSNNLNLNSGASPVFDISTSSSSGNDRVVVAGNLTLGSSDTIHVNALSGSAPLDQTADYVLFSVAGTTTMTTQPVLVFDNTPPSDASHYSIQTSGNNVVLRYSANAAPVVTSVIITNTADGSTVGTRGQSATIYVTVQPGSGTLGAGSVTANLSSLGGSSTQVLNYPGGNNWSYTIVLGQSAVVGTDSVGVTATDSLSASGSGVGSFTINASSLTWNGSGPDANWGTGGNWVGAVPPGFAGDSVTFTGSMNTSPNLEADYNVADVTFDGAAGSFTNGSTTGRTLTLSGPVINSSSNPQVFTLAITNNGTPTIAGGSAGITFAGPISGSGGLEVSGGTVTLAGTNNYLANTLIDSNATLKAGSGAALPYGSGVGNFSVSGTLDLNGNNAAINGLSGAGIVDNTSTNPAVLSIGNADTTSTFAGVIQNAGTNLTLIKTGIGTLTLSGVNTYSGGTTVSNGTLFLQGSSTPTSGTVTSGPLGTGTLTLNGGTLFGFGGSSAYTIANNVNVAAAINIEVNAVGSTEILNGNWSGSGNLTLIVNGTTGQWQFGGDNSGYTGTFTENVGNTSLAFNSASAGSANAAWVFNNPQNQRTRLNFGAGTINFGSLSGNGSIANIAPSGMATVSVGALNTSTTFSGVLGGSTAGQGQNISLVKIGTGTLTMSGANTYTGSTTVSNGTLIVSSQQVNSGDFTVIDGATLGVSLFSNGASLNMTSLTLGNNCTNSFTGINSTTVPAITNSGALTLSGQVVVNVQGTNFAVGQYPLISYASITGTGGFVLGSLPAGVIANITTNANTIVLNVSQVPVSGPVSITNSVSGRTLSLSWPPGQGWRLQMQTNSLATGLGTNWVYITDGSVSSTNITIDSTKPCVFYRLVYP